MCVFVSHGVMIGNKFFEFFCYCEDGVVSFYLLLA